MSVKTNISYFHSVHPPLYFSFPFLLEDLGSALSSPTGKEKPGGAPFANDVVAF